jgi:peroxiredoxin Q/BCP
MPPRKEAVCYAISPMALRVGQKAPDFDVVSSGGRRLKLSDFLGKKNVVLYFYPGDFTPVCTRETCMFRDAYEDLAAADTEVIGVSTDSDSSHERFVAAHNLPFSLVSDRSRTLAGAYGAKSLLRNLLGAVSRVTYVIDKKGEIAAVIQGELSATKHVEQAKAAIETLRTSA